MLNEITLPEDYTGTIDQENKMIQDINLNFNSLALDIANLNKNVLQFDTHIIDFEGYIIDVFFSENKSKATITVVDNNILIEISGKTIKVDSDGNIV